MNGRPTARPPRERTRCGIDRHRPAPNRSTEPQQDEIAPWSINQRPEPIIRRIVIIVTSLMTVSTVSLAMAYYGPETTETWHRRYDLLSDSKVPTGVGFIVEWLRAAIFLTLTTIMLGFRFTAEIRKFWNVRRWSASLILNRLVVFGVVGAFLAVEVGRHLNADQAPAELAAWGIERGIDTTPENEVGPYRWYLTYSMINYFVILGGLVTFPMIRFTMSDASYVWRRLQEFAHKLPSAGTAQAVSRRLIHFGDECRGLAGRYVDLMAVLVIGVHYDWWVGWRTLSESAFVVLLLGWVVTGILAICFVIIAAIYSRAYELAANRVVLFGSVAAEAEISRLGASWLLKRCLLGSLSGLICLSISAVLFHAFAIRMIRGS